MSNSPNNANVIQMPNKAADQLKYEAAMKTSLARLPRAIQLVRELSQKHFKASIQNLFDHVDDALFELADKAASNLEQNVYFESMRDIRIHRRTTEKTFVDHIDERFAGLLSESVSEEEAYSADLSDQDGLSLVEKEELEELVAIDSLVNRASSHNKQALRVLAHGFHSILGHEVSESHNPISPRSLADCFVEAAQQISIDIKARLVLFKLFERHVMNELEPLLKSVTGELSKMGVSLPSKSRSNSQARKAPPVTPPPLSDYRLDSQQSTDLYETLQSLIQNQGAASSSEGGFVATDSGQADQQTVSTTLLAALSQIQQQHLQHVATTNGALIGQQAELLSAGRIQQQVQASTGLPLVDGHSEGVIKLVDMLFSFILQDHNLPDPIKLLLSQLQIPYIKVALADDGFFKQEGHPARRLLNEMAMASIGWAGDINSDKKDPLLTKIESTVKRILSDFDSNLEIFTLLLTDFIAFMEKERRRMILFERRVIDAEDGKAKAEVGRQRVDEELAQLMEGKSLPNIFVNFIKGPWSNTLFLIFMRQGPDSEQWAESIDCCRKLVWSTQPIKSAEHRKQLIALWPHLMKSMKTGLDNISFNPAKQTRFFNHFTAYYQSLIKAFDNPAPAPEVEIQVSATPEVTAASPEAAAPIVEDPISPTVNQEKPMVVQEPPIEKASVSEVVSVNEEKVEESVEVSTEANTVEESAVVEDDKTASPQYLNLVDNFTVGTWCEKQDEKSGHYRCRLATIIRATGKYIFVNRSGIKVAEETRETLALLLESGEMRTLDDGMLFDRALESVISNLRNKR